jgi:Fe-S cluster assembly ATP-binding protein
MPDAAIATTTPVLEVKDLHVSVEGKEILKGVSLTVRPGEVHALMGRNGSGKSTLSATLMGHPRYIVTSGSVKYLGEDLLALPVHERARKGVFLCFQYPQALPGVGVNNFLRQSVKAVRGDTPPFGIPAKEFRPLVRKTCKEMGVAEAFMTRYVNDGFSGGEKKRLEILQMLLLQPKLAILDETDSGLDIDALKVIAKGINELRAPDRAQLLITHYQRILDYVTPHFVHVLMNGRIVKSGGPELAKELEVRGYDFVEKEQA